MTLGASAAIRRSIAARLATFARWTRISPLPRPRERRGLQLALDQVERALGPVDQDQAAGPDGEDLARQLRPDRSAAAGDEDRAVADDLLHAGGVLGDHRAPQEILDADPPDAVGVDAAIEEVRHRRDGPDVELERQGGLEDAPDGDAGRAGHRDQQRLGAGRGARPAPSTPRPPKTRSPATMPPARLRIVIEEPDGPDAGARVAPRGPRHEHAGVARAVEQGRPAVGDVSRHGGGRGLRPRPGCRTGRRRGWPRSGGARSARRYAGTHRPGAVAGSDVP